MAKRKFNPKAKAFSKINLAYLAYCSKLVYKTKDEIKSGLEKEGFKLESDSFYFTDEETDTQGFVAGDRNKIIVAFRGTEQKIDDIITNARISKKTWTEENPIGEVHSGFYDALKSVWDDIEKEIGNLRNNNQSVWLTGHSLGGALAALAAATLKFQGAETGFDGLYTFGQPRIGNREFSSVFNQSLKSRYFRIVNNNDVVTRIPPQIFGYSHAGTLKYFDADGKLHGDGDLSWWAKFWDRLEGGLDNFLNLTPDRISDHSMKIYQKLSDNA
jgi:triacylglycerol lipase